MIDETAKHLPIVSSREHKVAARRHDISKGEKEKPSRTRTHDIDSVQFTGLTTPSEQLGPWGSIGQAQAARIRSRGKPLSRTRKLMRRMTVCRIWQSVAIFCYSPPIRLHRQGESHRKRRTRRWTPDNMAAWKQLEVDLKKTVQASLRGSAGRRLSTMAANI